VCGWQAVGQQRGWLNMKQQGFSLKPWKPFWFEHDRTNQVCHRASRLRALG
jgi:hypothetical protein